VVESDDDVRDLLEYMLRSADHRVVTAATLADALRLFRSESYDLIVAAAVLKDGRGEELANAAVDCGIKAVLIGGSGEGVGAASGGCEILARPLSAQCLRRLVDA
jgi:DNA-binding NtrC family response regulator